MKIKSTKELSARVWFAGVFGALAFGLLAGVRLGAAPSVIASQAPVTPLTTDWQQSQPDEMDVFGASAEAGVNSLPQMFQYGPVQLRPHATYRFLYGNGIASSYTNQQTTAVQEISPGIRLGLGSHWTLDYTPTIRLYSNSHFRNTVDQAVSLIGGSQINDWIVGFSHSSAFTTSPLIETGAQTEQTTHATAFTASRALNSRLSADFSLNQEMNLVTGYQDSYNWSTLDWLNYQFWPRLTAGLGAGGGYVMIEDNSRVPGRGGRNLDQTFEQVEARVNWRITDKISLQLNGGLEDRQFQTAGSSDSLNPIFGASVQYQPFKPTRITLSASRVVGSSDYYLSAQQAESTVVSVNLDQRLLKKFHLGLGASYGRTDYNTSLAAVAANRTDDDLAFNVRLSHPFFKRGNWSVFYQYNDNQSSEKGFSLQSNQVGFEVGYAF